MSTKKQQFYGESKLYFFLREPKRTGPRLVYLSTYIGGKHYVLSTKVKVYACQWNYKNQLAVISNVQSKQDNRNNKIVNDQLSKVKRYFSEFIEYICDNDVDDIGETLKHFIYRDMAKKKKLNLKRIIAEALEYYHSYVKPSIKDSTKRQNESLLSEFNRFVDTLPEKEKTMRIFSQRGLNRYKQYLIDKMDRSKTDGKKRKFGVGQLNRCGAIIALLINRVLVEKEDDINPVVWNKVDDPRREDQKGHVPLLDNEIASIETCEKLTAVEKEYRDIFLLQIECGQRVSDLANILTGEYVVGHVDECECILLSTKKENVPAVVDLTPRVRMLMERIKAHKHVDPQKFKKKTEGKGNNTYNEAIRRIAKKAGLDRVIVKIESNQVEEKSPLYEIITNHDARSTFITNKIKEGVPPDKLCIMTGHASDEMINRVYAQLTIEDKIRSITPYLSSGKNEEDADSPTDALSEKPNELKAVVPKELQPIISTQNENEPLSIIESNEVIVYDNYIRELNNIVNKAINETKDFFCDEIYSFYEDLQKSCTEDIVEYRLTCEQFFESKDGIIELSHLIERDLREDASQIPDYSKDSIDIERLFYLRCLIDYLRENHVGEDAIESLEELFNAICEDNPNVFMYYQAMPHIKVVWPILHLFIVYLKTMQFVKENRPIPDETMFIEDNRFFKFLTDWSLVFRELQKTPTMKLEALIQNTNCRYDVKHMLYNSIKEGDFNSFYETIKTHEQEVRILIRHSYLNLYMRTAVQLLDYLLKAMTKGIEDPIKMYNRCYEAILLRNPYVDRVYDDPTPDSIMEDFQEMDMMDMKEGFLGLFDYLLTSLDDSYKYAYPSEKKIFNKLRSLVDLNKHAELKKAYDEYKAKQNTTSDTESSIVEAITINDKKKNNPEEQKKQTIVPNYIPIRPNNISIDELVRLLTQKDKLNNNYIFVTLDNCDSDEADVATCLKHFFGQTSPTPLSFKLRWNDKNKVSLKFLIRLLFNTNGKATRKNVIEKDAKKAYDGISGNVSKVQGLGLPIWPPVIEVFENCPKSIENAGAGDNDSEARKYNLKQLKTIANIYFACKK